MIEHLGVPRVWEPPRMIYHSWCRSIHHEWLLVVRNRWYTWRDWGFQPLSNIKMYEQRSSLIFFANWKFHYVPDDFPFQKWDNRLSRLRPMFRLLSAPTMDRWSTAASTQQAEPETWMVESAWYLSPVGDHPRSLLTTKQLSTINLY